MDGSKYRENDARIRIAFDGDIAHPHPDNIRDDRRFSTRKFMRNDIGQRLGYQEDIAELQQKYRDIIEKVSSREPFKATTDGIHFHELDPQNLINKAGEYFQKLTPDHQVPPNVPIYFLSNDAFREVFQDETYHSVIEYLTHLDAIVVSTDIGLHQLSGDQDLIKKAIEARYIGLLVSSMLQAQSRHDIDIYFEVNEDELDPYEGELKKDNTDIDWIASYGYLFRERGQDIGTTLFFMVGTYLQLMAMERYLQDSGESGGTIHAVLEPGKFATKYERSIVSLNDMLYLAIITQNSYLFGTRYLEQQFTELLYAGTRLNSAQMELKRLVNEIMPPKIKRHAEETGETIYDQLMLLNLNDTDFPQKLIALLKEINVYREYWEKKSREQSSTH